MAKGRGGLGRGLESLFEDAAPSFESDTRIETLPLREIEPDPGQPRKTFDDETLAELSASIAEHGLLQPIAVRPKPSGGYLIVAGERRWRASRMAGLTGVPVIVKDVTDEQAMELALVENLQREDLDPVEEAAGIGSEFKLQRITAQRLIFEAVLFVQLVVPVFSVTEQSVTDIRKVRSYLMRPACEQVDL